MKYNEVWHFVMEIYLKKKKKEIFKQRRLKLKNLNVIITSTFFWTGIYILVTNQYNTDNMNSQLKSILQ